MSTQNNAKITTGQNKPKPRSRNLRRRGQGKEVAGKRRPVKLKKLEPKGKTVMEQVQSIRTLGPSPTAVSVGTSTLIIPTNLTLDTVTIALATLESYILAKGLTAVLSQSDIDGGDALTSGLAFLGQGLVSITAGTTFDLTKVPRCFDIMIGLLTPKVVRIGPQSVRYSPNWGAQYEYPNNFSTEWGTIYLTPVTVGGNTQPIISGSYIGDKDKYSNMLKMCDNNKSWGLTVVDMSKGKGLYRIDPSAYARNYVYFGAAGVGAGLYSEAELEVPFHYPRWSKFVPYNPEDEVVSRVFTPQSGGISGPIALTLLDAGVEPYAELKSPYPVMYKYLNLYDVVNVLIGWLIGIFNSTPLNVQGQSFFSKPTQFAFSVKDFAWLVRQAVLSIFPSQIAGQFIAPVKSMPSQNSSVFQPFIVDGVTTPLQSLTNMLVPLFVNENLAMLGQYSIRPRSTPNSRKYNTTPKKLRHDFVPIWGVYSGDELPVPMFEDDQGNSIPIFNPNSIIPDCRLSDGVSIANNNQKIVANNYLPGILTAWNTIVEGFAKHLSTAVISLTADVNPTTSLLSYTRVLKKFDPLVMKAKTKEMEQPMDKFILNKPSVKKMAIPPATYYELYTYEILSHCPFDATVLGILKNMILPSIRFDYTGDDKLTSVAYSVYTTEMCSSLNYTNEQSAQQESLRQFNTGLMCVQGLFGTNADNNELMKGIQLLNDWNRGGSMIGSLLGGLASMIPVIGPLVSDVVSNL